MKKKFIILLFVILMATAAAAFAACTAPDGKLAAPANFLLDDDEFFTWDEVEGADSYLVEIDGITEEVTENRCVMEDGFTENTPIRIRAMSNSFDYDHSEWADFLYEVPTEALTYNLLPDGSGYEVTRKNSDVNTGLEGRVVMRDYYNGLPVTSIAEEAFFKYNSMDLYLGISESNYRNHVTTSLRLPALLKYIGEDAFRSLTALESVTLPEGVEIVMDSFYECINLVSVYIPKSVKQLNGTFSRCEKLQSIELPEITEIAAYTFTRCYSLKSIALPESVTSIGINAFYECYNLRTIIFGKDVKSFYGKSFGGCDKLDCIFYTGTQQQWEQIEVLDYDEEGMYYFERAVTYFYSEEQPTEEGNFWHYAEDGKTPIIWD